MLWDNKKSQEEGNNHKRRKKLVKTRAHRKKLFSSHSVYDDKKLQLVNSLSINSEKTNFSEGENEVILIKNEFEENFSGNYGVRDFQGLSFTL